MGTECALQLAASSEAAAAPLANMAINEIARLEQKYSRYIADSVLSAINASAGKNGFEVDSETAELINYAASSYEQSDGLFDITSGVLRKAWDFRRVGAKSSSQALPTANVLENLLASCGWPKVGWDGRCLMLPKGFELDLGGLVKEYAADCAKKCLQQAGVQSALIDLGGDVVAFGGDWPIGIKDPSDPVSAKVHITLQNGALATSGNYERTMLINGKRYSHILNPKTGWPIESAASITVMADNCLIAGTVSTIAMLAGNGHAFDVLEEFGLPYFCVLNDGRVIDRLAEHSI